MWFDDVAVDQVITHALSGKAGMNRKYAKQIARAAVEFHF